MSPPVEIHIGLGRKYRVFRWPQGYGHPSRQLPWVMKPPRGAVSLHPTWHDAMRGAHAHRARLLHRWGRELAWAWITDQ